MDDVDKIQFGRRALLRRKELGMTQKAVARAAGMSQQGILNIERGDVERPRRLTELAWALHTSVEWLLWEKGPKAVQPPTQNDPSKAPPRRIRRAG